MNLDDLMFRPDCLRGHKILITGGGTGLGRVMAEAALLLGAQVVIAGRRGGLLRETAEALMGAHCGTVIPITCDIRDPLSIDTLLETAWADGPVTDLINNAAGNFISRTEDLSPNGFDAVASTVFRGSFLVTLGCGKRWLPARQSASVISILTTWVWNGSPFVLPSAMSKAGLAAMTQSLAVEWAGRGVRFNAIAPGAFPTEGMSARLRPGAGDDVFADMSANPMGRVGRMPEIANLAVYLLHPLSAYINGQIIAIDGAGYQATGGNFSSLREWGDTEWQAARAAIRSVTQKDAIAREA